MSKYANSFVIIINSLIFWVTPIVLVIHLALNQKMTSINKKRLSYIYGGIWMLAFLNYLIIFVQSLT